VGNFSEGARLQDWQKTEAPKLSAALIFLVTFFHQGKK
jgi:hypothetical protein